LSIYVFVFGPKSFVESLVGLSLTEDLVTQVGVPFDADDATLYNELLHTIHSSVDDQQNGGEQILILTPQMGGRYSTVALSMPREEIYVISGINVDMLSSLKMNEKLFNLYTLGIIKTPNHAVSELKKQKVEDMLSESKLRQAIYTLAEELCHHSQNGIILLNQLLREEGEDSNIDASILETDFSQII
jgi:mannose/fructose-specific phosphotransferase system component IIA